MSIRLDDIASDFEQDSSEGRIRSPQGYRAVKPYLRLTPQPNR